MYCGPIGSRKYPSGPNARKIAPVSPARTPSSNCPTIPPSRSAPGVRNAGLTSCRPISGHWLQYVRNTIDRSSWDSATTATGQATSRPSCVRCTTSSTTARPSAAVVATVSVRRFIPASHSSFWLTKCRTSRRPRTSPARGSKTTTSPGQAVSRSRASALFSAVTYCPTGSARPAARVCSRVSSTALVNSGNHGI